VECCMWEKVQRSTRPSCHVTCNFMHFMARISRRRDLVNDSRNATNHMTAYCVTCRSTSCSASWKAKNSSSVYPPSSSQYWRNVILIIATSTFWLFSKCSANWPRNSKIIIRSWALDRVHNSRRPLDRLQYVFYTLWSCDLEVRPFDLILFSERGLVTNYPCGKFGDCSFSRLGSIAFNVFLHIVTLWPWPSTFWSQKFIQFVGYPKLIPSTKFEHFGSIRFWVIMWTNKQTKTDRITDRQTRMNALLARLPSA